MIECKAVVPIGVGQDVLDLIERDLVQAFDGCCWYVGQGLWCDPDQGGRVLSEPIVTYVCAVKHPVDGITFSNIIERHCRNAGERYLYVTIPDPFAITTAVRIINLNKEGKT